MYLDNPDFFIYRFLRRCFLSFLGGLFLLLSYQTLLAKEIYLNLGENKNIQSAGKLWVEKSGVINANESGANYVLKGISPGNTIIKNGNNTDEVFVFNPSQERTLKILSNLLPKTLGLKIEQKNGKIKIIGHLLIWENWDKIFQACEASSCDYQFSATIENNQQNQIRRKIDMIFKMRGLPPQAILFDHELKSLVSEKNENSGKIISVLKALGIKPILSNQNVDLEPLIKVQITVAEVKRNAFIKYGVEWANNFQAQLLPKLSTESLSSDINLQALEENGLGKVLATPNLLCKSGKEAEFLAGGEFPIKIMNFRTQDVVWKKYGILLKIQPKADFSGKMSISIETEVSSIDTQTTVDGVPGLFTNRIQSHFDLSESRTIALSGLIKSEQGDASKGLPGLGHIPVLGPLFASHDFRENRTELVVFVRPQVLSPGSLEATP